MSTATAIATAVRTFAIDTSHSEVTFQVRHLITKVRSHFSDFGGTIEFDAENPVNSTVNVTIQAASIDTNEPKRDGHLRSDDFFSTETYPTLSFTSVKTTRTGGDHYDVEGDLTIRDVTRRMVLPVTHLGTAKDPWGNEKLAFKPRRPSTARSTASTGTRRSRPAASSRRRREDRPPDPGGVNQTTTEGGDGDGGTILLRSPILPHANVSIFRFGVVPGFSRAANTHLKADTTPVCKTL